MDKIKSKIWVMICVIGMVSLSLKAKEIQNSEIKILKAKFSEPKVPSPIIDTNRIWVGSTSNLTGEVTIGKYFKGANDDTIRIITVQSSGTRYLVIATDTASNQFGKNKFRIETPYSFGTYTPYAVAIGNVDGDEFKDIVVSLSSSPYTIYWFEWDDLTPSWVLRSSFNVSNAVYDIVIGDADNDGNDNEIIATVATTSPPTVVRAIWNGSNFDITTINLTGTVPPRGIAIGDVRPDLSGNEIYVCGSSYIWMIYYDGGNWQVTVITSDVTASWDIAIGDIDAELLGNEFAVVHGSTLYQISVWNWTGSIWSGRRWGWTNTWGTSDNEIAIGDIITDNYGNEIIVTGGSSTSATPYIFWVGPGGSGWVRGLPKAVSGQYDYGVAIGDVNRFRNYNQEFVISGGGSLVEGEQRVFANDVGIYWIRMKNPTPIKNVEDTITLGIFNAGYQPQTNFQINYSFLYNPATGTRLYNRVLPPFGTDTVKIPIPGINYLGVDTLTVKTNLTGDQNPSNDLVRLHFEFYDDSTKCASGFNAVLFPPSNSTIPPTLWKGVIISGSYNWERFTNPTNPSAPILEGYAVAGYRSFNASSGSKARLITHPFNTGNNARKIMLRFYMYHDPGYSTSPDSIIVEYSYDAINFFRVAGFARYSATAGWTQHNVEIGDFPPNKNLYVSFLAKSGYGNNMFIDSVRIFATTPTAASNDAGIIQILPFAGIIHVGDTLYVNSVIKNFGLNPITSVPVFYTLGGSDTIIETWTGYLEINEVDTFTFSTPFIPQDTGIITLYSGTLLQGDQNPSNDVSSITFRVCPLYHVPPYTKNFDENWSNSTNPPFCGWEIIDGGSQSPPIVDNNDWHRYVSTSPARTVARVYWSPIETHDDWLISPRFNCSSWGTYTLSFWHYYNDFSASRLDSGRVLLSTDGGTTWTKIAMYSNADDSGYKYFDITQFVNGKDNVKIAFHYVAYNEFWWYVDDFSIEFTPDNQGPNITVIQIPQNAYAGPYIVKAIIQDISGISSDSLYYIVNDTPYGITHTQVSGDTFTYEIPDQTPGRVVEFYIKAKDNALNVSYTQMYSFYILYPIAPSGLTAYGVPGENEVKLKWNAPYEELSYDSGPYYYWSGWASGDMIATRFTPQYNPCKIQAVAMMFYQIPDTAELIIWTDDGTGNPGNIIYQDTVIITNLYPDYQIFDLSNENIIISSGEFHVGIKWLGDDSPYIISDDTSYTTRSKYNIGAGWQPAGYDFLISSFVYYLPGLLSSNKIKENKIEKEISLSFDKRFIKYPRPFKKPIAGRISYKKPNLYKEILKIENFEILRGITPGGPYTSIGTTVDTFYADPNVNTHTIYYYVVKANYIEPETTSAYSNEAQIGVDFTPPLYENTTFGLIDTTLYVSTQITDWTGLLYDSLGYRFNGGSFEFISHDSIVGSNYYYSIPISSGVNIIEFYLFSRDSSWWRNFGRDPDTGFYQFTGIKERIGNIPAKLFLNILNSVSKDKFIKIAYGIPKKTNVEITVYDLLGRKIRTLLNDIREPGIYYLLWNGCDKNGKEIGNGVYFVKIKTEEKEEIKKFVRIR